MVQDENALRAAVAVTRFGLGARPGEMEVVAADPQGWLAGQIRRTGTALPAGDFPDSEARLVEFNAYLRNVREVRQERRQTPPSAMPATAEPMEQEARSPEETGRRALAQSTAAQFLARAQLGATTPDGFAERWALFWSNVLTVSFVKFGAGVFMGQYEREAIRPFVFGRFEDLLVAAESHPAMLIYLDQAQSIGPNSVLGERRDAGLNANLAREILELHTVGVDAGYSQADVTELARALTGWSVPAPRDAETGRRGGGGRRGGTYAQALAVERGPRGFAWRPGIHEPGSRTVMGRRYNQNGVDQGEAILRDLANNPATARRLARRIAVHFVTDDPPVSLVNRLEAAWTGSRGDLGAVALALITAPEAWDPAPAKIKTPYEFVISTHRALGYPPQRIQPLQQALTAMGQPPFSAPSPEGWPDTAADWAGPDALVKRLDRAKTVGDRAEMVDPNAVALGALGPRLSERTRMAVARAESRAEALTLFLMSPEFQRR